MSWDDDFPGARASRPRSQVPNQQLINPFIAVHSCPFVVRRSPWSPFPSWPRGYLFAFSRKSFVALRPDPWRSLLQPLSGPSTFFVALRGYLFAFWKSFLPFPTLRRPLSSLLQPLSGPSPFFVALRGYLFAEIPPLARPDPSQASSNPLVALRRSSWPFVDIFLPFPGNLFSPSRPLADPSQASSNPLVALRRSSWPFVDIFLPFPGNPFSPSRPLADPSQAFSNPLVALRGPSCPFVDNSFPLPSQICPTPN